MNPEKPPPPEDANEEISALIETLHQTGQRLEDLTAGEVDTVTDRDGRTFVLRHVQEQLRHSEAAKQAAILNALPAHIALLDTQGRIISVNEAWRRFGSPNVLHGPGYGIGLNYLEICDSARGDDASEAHQVAEGIRSVLDGGVKSFSIEYPCHSPLTQSWFLLTVTPLADDPPHGVVVMHLNITERKRAEQAQSRLIAIIEATPDMVATGDPNGHVLYYNPAGLRMLGFEPGLDLSTVRFLDTHPDWAAKLVIEEGIPHAIEHGTWSGETALLGRDRREIPVSQVLIAHKGPDGSVEYLSTIARDITLQKESEKRITRLNRVYAVLSGINTTIVRTRDRQELFDDACRIAVEQGKFRLAWIGLVDANGLDVTPVARAGVDEGYLDNIQLTARDDAPDRCEMVARALREKTAVVCNDIDTDPQMARWREEALRRGYRSVVVLPLQLEDKVTSLLLLYASEAGFFDTDEMRLLSEIAGDISFALDHIDKQEQLRAAEEQFRGLVEQSIAGIYIIQDDKLAYVNPRFAEIHGFGSADELIGRNALPLVAEKDRGTVAENRRRLLAGEAQSANYNFTALRKDASEVEVGVSNTGATYRGRSAIIGMMQDISEKKRAEDEIKGYVAQLESAFMSTVEVATTLGEMRDPYTAGHQRRVAEIAVAIGAELGFDTRRQEGLRVAGLLHDVGKINVPAEILTKPGKLSPIQFQLIQGHAQAGYDVLKGVEFPWPVAQVALQHHERMDGSGYPQGLKGDAILLEAKILAVADVVEAMSSHRPYRQGRGIKAALSEIEHGRGSVYDPAVADACLKLFREKGYAIPG